ncbi:serine/threonine-protein kinase Nek8-like isoform X2 [Corticium candelabrum]|uniref:serine/threonine-protein kinase Nek8-like isoform X2 n=1 Tax=Corticium candelabrum TaxID=121492 RepID=UPI002E2670A5|nr:serine/threonine-protein kinase Nek8-like isoform X2 [Corticium candelabrum]
MNFLEDKALMIAMEYAQGGTIFEYLQQRGDHLLNEEEIMHLFVQILLSLQHVHSRNILHRDLKTQNIMLCKKRKVVKVGDFGISKVLSSKSKAHTVVGTPCYISPELCEGKPYNQKSDIWALGCVLYELATLQRAFEASNLPALVLKIMRGTFAPISPRYSDHLKQLILSMLHLDPSQRPQLNEIMAQPIVISALINLQTDIGRVPLVASASHAMSYTSHQMKHGRSVSVPGLTDFDHYKLRSTTRPSVYYWGGGVAIPLMLAVMSDAHVQTVACGRMQKLGVTADGRVVTWQTQSATMTTMTSRSDGSSHRDSYVSVPRYVDGLSGVTVKQVSCGDLFTACLTERGILMTFGNGINGALGHGHNNDIAQPKIVEALLSFSVHQVSCGACHMAAVTVEGDVFTWGRGDNGRLGLGSVTSHTTPQQVIIPSSHQTQSVFCGTDCSVILTQEGIILACGSNRCNKLALDQSDRPSSALELKTGKSEKPFSASSQSSFPAATSVSASEDVSTFTAVTVAPLCGERVTSIAMGTSHTAVLSEKGQCFTVGSNAFGQLGYRRDAALKGPQLVRALDGKRVDLVQCGDTFTVAVTSGGHVYTWGKGKRGRLGRESEEDCFEPTLVPFEDHHTVQSVCCSHGHTLMACKSLTSAASR